jgi:hypothetical protein
MSQTSHSIYSTTYNKWQAVERDTLFYRLSFVDATALSVNGAIAKLGSAIDVSILSKVQKENALITNYEGHGEWTIAYTRKLSHFVQILDFVPVITDEHGTARDPSELKLMRFESKAKRDVFLAILNSSLFYWFLTVYSDCRNLNRREIDLTRFDYGKAEKMKVTRTLSTLAAKLMQDIRKHSKVVSMTYKSGGTLNIQCTYPKFSKRIIDEIDNVLGRYLQFSPEEIDYVTNYDVKYRTTNVQGEDD